MMTKPDQAAKGLFPPGQIARKGAVFPDLCRLERECPILFQGRPPAGHFY